MQGPRRVVTVTSVTGASLTVVGVTCFRVDDLGVHVTYGWRPGRQPTSLFFPAGDVALVTVEYAHPETTSCGVSDT